MNPAAIKENVYAKNDELYNKWVSYRRINDQFFIMAFRTQRSIKFAPLYKTVHNMTKIKFHAKMSKYWYKDKDWKDMDNIADKLRYLRIKKGLIQKDVANYLGINIGTYKTYEDKTRIYYPKNHIIKLSELYNVPIENILDDYNRFLYEQGMNIIKIRQMLRMDPQEFALYMNVDRNTVRCWEKENTVIPYKTWTHIIEKSLPVK